MMNTGLDVDGVKMWAATMRLHGVAFFGNSSIEEIRMVLDSKSLDYTYKVYKTGWVSRTHVFKIRHEDKEYLNLITSSIAKWADEEEQ